MATVQYRLRTTIPLLRTAAIVFLSLVLIAAGIVYWLYEGQRSAYWDKKNLDERHVVALAVDAYADELRAVVSDLRYLANQPQLKQWLATGTTEEYTRLAKDYRIFSMTRGRYDQIRFLGTDGFEKIRVDENRGAPAVVPMNRLQNKSDRYYVTETAQLEDGALYVSQFDLNNEFGVLERPLKPMIRFATPVFDEEGRRRGMFVLNYFGQPLLDQLATIGGRDGKFWIVNEDGYWLLGPSAAQEWGFMFPGESRPKFSDAYPDVWAQLSTAPLGQISTAAERWTYAELGGPQQVHDRPVRFPRLWIMHVVSLAAGPSGAVHLGALGAVAMLLAVASALVARHKISSKLAEAQIVELNEQLESENEQLETANNDLESFTYSVSHDLRAPVRAIGGFSAMLNEDHGRELGPEGRRKVGIIKAEAERLGTLIDELLRFFRGGRATFALEALDMTELAKSCFDRLILIEPSTVELRLGPLPEARGDRTLIEQVWTNLLANAIKFSSKSSKPVIEIQGESEPGAHTYSVRDNGAGFDPKYQDKLFGVFQRLHTDAEYPGTGIGLAFVQKILSRHGGRIWAESQPGRGATFHFSLPA